MKKLEGKVAVITGGSRGIGLATAQRFVDEGAYVFITGRRQSELDAAVKLIGKNNNNNNVTGVQGDVSNLADLDRLYATVKEQKGRIDIYKTVVMLCELLLRDSALDEEIGEKTLLCRLFWSQISKPIS
jgi:NAD(P)-dependent dehydrogenase (short-subunit alcohol dehydrogenase family)